MMLLEPVYQSIPSTAFNAQQPNERQWIKMLIDQMEMNYVSSERENEKEEKDEVNIGQSFPLSRWCISGMQWQWMGTHFSSMMSNFFPVYVCVCV